MAIKQKPVFYCDTCKCEMDKPFCVTNDVPHEGMSDIQVGSKTFDVGGQHYCSFNCLFEDIKDSLS